MSLFQPFVGASVSLATENQTIVGLKEGFLLHEVAQAVFSCNGESDYCRIESYEGELCTQAFSYVLQRRIRLL